MTSLHRLFVLTLLVAVATVGLAGPALAHGRGSDASNFLSLITDVPSVDGLSWAVINSDEYLELTNTSDDEVTIPGYSQEPYLRIGPDGVFRNRNSHATYLNEDRFGDVRIPPEVDVNGDPDWEQVSDGNSYAWHDHRIHWMASAEPPGVQTDPDNEQVVNPGREVPFVVGETEYAVVGDLIWVPGGSPWIWLVPALLVLMIPLAIGLRTKPDLEKVESRVLSTPMGITLMILALANIIHLVDDLFATPIPLSQSSVSAVQTAFFIAIAAFGAWRAIQGEEGAFTALGVGAGPVFIGQGLLYFSVLGASQTASLFPGWLTRVVVALSVAQLIPMAIATVMGTRALLPEFDEDDLAAETAI